MEYKNTIISGSDTVNKSIESLVDNQMPYKLFMDYLYNNCQAKEHNVMCDVELDSPKGIVRMVVIDFPETIGQQVYTFDSNGDSRKIVSNEIKSEMMIYDYVKLLTLLNILFDFDIDHIEEFNIPIVVVGTINEPHLALLFHKLTGIKINKQKYYPN